MAYEDLDKIITCDGSSGGQGGSLPDYYNIDTSYRMLAFNVPEYDDGGTNYVQKWIPGISEKYYTTAMFYDGIYEDNYMTNDGDVLHSKSEEFDYDIKDFVNVRLTYGVERKLGMDGRGSELKTAQGQELPKFTSTLYDFITTRYRFDVNGNYVFVLDGNTLKRHSLSAHWNISTFSDTVDNSITLSTDVVDIQFNDTGTKLFVLLNGGAGDDKIIVYTMTTAWDLSTATLSGEEYDFSAQTNSAISFGFNEDGTVLVIAGNGTHLYSYNLSTGWDVSTATFDEDNTVGFIIFGISNIKENKLFCRVNSGANRTLIVYWNGSNYIDWQDIDYGESNLPTNGKNINLINVYDSNGYNILLIVDRRTYWFKYNSSSGYRYYIMRDVAIGYLHPSGVSIFNAINNRLYDKSSFTTINEYGLYIDGYYGTIDTNTIITSNTITVSDLYNIRNIYFNNDGTQVIIVGTTDITGKTTKLYLLDLSTAYDLSTYSLNSETILHDGENITNIVINKNFDKINFGVYNSELYLYKLTTPGDLSTLTLYKKFETINGHAGFYYNMDAEWDTLIEGSTELYPVIWKDGDIFGFGQTYGKGNGVLSVQYQACELNYINFVFDIGVLFQGYNSSSITVEFTLNGHTYTMKYKAFIGDYIKQIITDNQIQNINLNHIVLDASLTTANEISGQTQKVGLNYLSNLVSDTGTVYNTNGGTFIDLTLDTP